MKSNQYYTVGTIPKYDRIIVETKKKLISQNKNTCTLKVVGLTSFMGLNMNRNQNTSI
jgi:hypothetical protein